MKKIIFVVLLCTLFSCTDNEMARNYGGKEEVTLPVGTKLLNLTWKEDHLWYLTRPMTNNETPETYTFQEKSNYGILQGEIIIKETK